MTLAKRLLGRMALAGVVVTGDAQYTQRSLCQSITAGGGDYVLAVKGNQPQLHQDLELLWRKLPQGTKLDHARSLDKHGDRLERRQLWCSSALQGYLDWPGAKQVALIERRVKRKGVERQEWAYLLTSLPHTQADARRLLELGRGHWSIENRLHYVRDVTMGEDACRVRTGAAPQVLAAIRNLVIGLLRLAGYTNIAAAIRSLAWSPDKALALIGIAIA